MDLQKLAPILEQIIIESLQEKVYPFGFSNYQGLGDKVASGRLRDSVEVTYVKDREGIEILMVIMEDYAQYVQSGRLGGKGKPPVQPLIEWIKSRGLKGRDKKGRFITDKSFAFAIRNNIGKFGIRPAPFVDISVNKILNDQRFVDIIENATIEEINKILIQV